MRGSGEGRRGMSTVTVIVLFFVLVCFAVTLYGGDRSAGIFLCEMGFVFFFNSRLHLRKHDV